MPVIAQTNIVRLRPPRNWPELGDFRYEVFARKVADDEFETVGRYLQVIPVETITPRASAQKATAYAASLVLKKMAEGWQWDCTPGGSWTWHSVEEFAQQQVEPQTTEAPKPKPLFPKVQPFL